MGRRLAYVLGPALGTLRAKILELNTFRVYFGKRISLSRAQSVWYYLVHVHLSCMSPIYYKEISGRNETINKTGGEINIYKSCLAKEQQTTSITAALTHNVTKIGTKDAIKTQKT
jgi:beta-lactamase regulating signal transducer with metallopeptidase domain